MKKIFLFSLVMCLGIVESFFAATDKGTYKCQVQSISALSRKSSNEFLFPTNADYKDSNGRALVCGHRDIYGCSNGTTVVVAGNHWFQKMQSDDMKVYRCSTGGGNAWADVGYTALPKCSPSQEKNWNKIGEINGQNILCKDKIDTFYRGGYCINACFTSGCPDCNDNKVDPNPRTVPMCKRFDGSNSRVGVNITITDSDMCPDELKKTGANKCRCTCVDEKNPHWQCDVNTCVDKKTVNKNQKNTTGGLGICEEKKDNDCDKYKKYDKRYACCVAGKSTKWNGKDMSNDGNCECVDKDMTWNGKKCVKKITPNPTPRDNDCEKQYSNPEAVACCKIGKTWFLPAHTCLCGDGFDWKYDEKTKTGECVAKSAPVSPSTECTETECTITINQKVKCYNGNYFNSTENYSVCKEDLDAQRLDCDGLKARVNACTDTDCIRKLLNRIDAYDELIKRVCGGSGVVPTPVPDNGAEILAAENTLTSFFRNAESNASVWKDKDGNFNTARLASDLTAGVILGTVGGVVSGVVIKKKQVEKGFDALHCTVGGQTVADWGDIFNVGLRR